MKYFYIFAFLALLALASQVEARTKFIAGFEGCHLDYDANGNSLIFTGIDGQVEINTPGFARQNYCDTGSKRGEVCANDADCSEGGTRGSGTFQQTCAADTDNTCSVRLESAQGTELNIGSPYIAANTDSASAHLLLNIPRVDERVAANQTAQLIADLRDIKYVRDHERLVTFFQASGGTEKKGCYAEIQPRKAGAGGSPCTSDEDCRTVRTSAQTKCLKAMCRNGTRDGDPCEDDEDCDTGTCEDWAHYRYCSGGVNDGNECRVDGDCGVGGTCVESSSLRDGACKEFSRGSLDLSSTYADANKCLGDNDCALEAERVESTCTIPAGESTGTCTGDPGEYAILLYYGDNPDRTVCSGGLNDETQCTACVNAANCTAESLGITRYRCLGGLNPRTPCMVNTDCDALTAGDELGECASTDGQCFNGAASDTGGGACNNQCVARTDGEQWCIDSALASTTTLYTNRWYELNIGQDNSVADAGDVLCSLSEGGFSRGFRTTLAGVCEGSGDFTEGWACSTDAECGEIDIGDGNGNCNTTDAQRPIARVAIGDEDHDGFNVTYNVDSIVIADADAAAYRALRIAEIWPQDGGNECQFGDANAGESCLNNSDCTASGGGTGTCVTVSMYTEDFNASKSLNCAFSNCDNNNNNGNRDECVNDTSRDDSGETDVDAPQYPYIPNLDCDRRVSSGDDKRDQWPLTNYVSSNSDLGVATQEDRDRWGDVLAAATYVVVRDNNPSTDVPAAIETRFGFEQGSGFSAVLDGSHEVASDFDGGNVQGIGPSGVGDYTTAAYSLISAGSYSSFDGPDDINNLQLQVRIEKDDPSTGISCSIGCGSRYTSSVIEVVVPQKIPTPPGVLEDVNEDGNVTLCHVADSTGNQGDFNSTLTAASVDVDTYIDCTEGSTILDQMVEDWDDILDGVLGGHFACKLTKGFTPKPCDYVLMGPIGVNSIWRPYSNFYENRCEEGPKKGIGCHSRCAQGDLSAGNNCRVNADCDLSVAGDAGGTCDPDYECPESECVMYWGGYCHGGEDHGAPCYCDEAEGQFCLRTAQLGTEICPADDQFAGTCGSRITPSACKEEACTSNADCGVGVSCETNADCGACVANGAGTMIFGCRTNSDCEVFDYRESGPRCGPNSAADFGKRCKSNADCNGQGECLPESDYTSFDAYGVGCVHQATVDVRTGATGKCENAGKYNNLTCTVNADCNHDGTQPTAECGYATKTIGAGASSGASCYQGECVTPCRQNGECNAGVVNSAEFAIADDNVMETTMRNDALSALVTKSFLYTSSGEGPQVFGCIDAPGCGDGVCVQGSTNARLLSDMQQMVDQAESRSGFGANCVNDCRVKIVAVGQPKSERDIVTDGTTTASFAFFGLVSEVHDAYTAGHIEQAKQDGDNFIDLNRLFETHCDGRNSQTCMADAIHWNRSGFREAAELISQCLENESGTSDGICSGLTQQCTVNADCSSVDPFALSVCDSGYCTGICTSGALGGECSADSDCDLYKCDFN